MDFYIIDGNSYVYRAFYAIRGLSNSKGFPTNAIYGFTNMLMKIIRDRSPDGLAVSFDSPVPTERHMIFKDYKVQRPEIPAELAEQLPHIRKVISAFKIKIFEYPGYEADDLIGTVAKKASKKGASVFIVSNDKDMLQLVDERIKVYDPVKDRVLDSEYVKTKFGVGPERVTEFMALTGDAADNIPGIRGIGEKTAKELLSLFKSIDELFACPEKIKKERVKKLVAENREVALLSRRLATINTSAPLEFEMQEFNVAEPDWPMLLHLFNEYEFVRLMKLVPSAGTGTRACETVISADRLRQILSGAKKDFAFDVETTGKNPITDSLVGIALCLEKERSYYIPVAHTPTASGNFSQMDRKNLFQVLGPVFGDESVNKIGHNLKYDIMILGREGVDVRGKLLDTMVAAYLLNPNKSAHNLDEVSLEHLSKRKKPFVEVLGKRRSFAEVPVEEAAPYASEDAALSFELSEVLFGKLMENGLETIYFDIEMPLIHVLIDMENAGIKIDAEHLNRLSSEVAVELESLKSRIYFLAGEEFNINSPKQLATILFQRLGLKPSKKTKTGFSTGIDVLEELAGEHELPREVIQYRGLIKLKTTYLDALPELVNPETGRVHTSFNQTVTATGRLSSSSPNLQNIPVKGDMGKSIREAFIADEGNVILSADYSQVELRVLAHLSGDKGLIDAFSKDLDIHTRTASEIYGLPFEKVTPDMRRTAKTVNFGVIYGISAFGLSETLNIDRKEAERYINSYFERHPGVREYVEKVCRDAEEKGFVTTLFGRKRPVPEIKSRNRNIRQQGERLAMNSPVQGTAADIIKIAMINIRKRLRDDSVNARMILQVHDELLFELPASELDMVRQIVREGMEGAVSLSVPLRVDIGYGKNWSEAH